VNQNLPPNQPGQSGDYSSGQAANPYYTEAPPVDPASLDASAPQLKNTESQKINTKALLFLGGIVLLLVLLTVLVVMSGGDDEDATKQVREQQQQVLQPQRPSSLDPLDPLAGGEPVPAETLPPVPVEPIPVQPAPPPPPSQPSANQDGYAEPQGPRGPTLAERRMGADASETVASQNPGIAAQLEMLKTLQGMDPNSQAAKAAQASADEDRKVNRAQFLYKADTLLLRGTYIRCVLETRIITDVEGFASCIVTEPVYSVNGRSLLLPKGSKVSGKYTGEVTGPRVAVVWDRITTPTGIDMNMESPGVDNLGSAGHPGDYDGHWASKISSALFISLLSDAFKYFGEKEGPSSAIAVPSVGVVEQPFQSNTARQIDRIANQAVEKSLRRPATVTINQGTVVNIYVAKDVDFSGVVMAKPR
jgi:type IV secretion system protein VirB10